MPCLIVGGGGGELFLFLLLFTLETLLDFWPVEAGMAGIC